MKLRLYISLIKPGLVRGNLLTAAAGFFLASRLPQHVGSSLDWKLLLAMLVGISLVVASGCVFNNYRDRDMDAHMDRTRRRALVTGEVSLRGALIFGSLLLALGLLVLAICTTLMAAAIALCGFLVYVFWYTSAKRTTMYATHIGALSGAVPPIVGYTALSNSLDWGTLALFLILMLWQMPHFFSIAINRSRDYAAAGIPALPLRTSLAYTKILIVLYITAFTIAVSLPFLLGLGGIFYLTLMLTMGIIWLILALAGFGARDVEHWARMMFRFSLVVILGWCIAIFLNFFL